MNTSSLICKNFAQNAWKKDLCSNCFKSEVEHWPKNHININEDVNERDAQNLTNNSSIKMNIKNMQINMKNDCNSTTTPILKKSSNTCPQVINTPKKFANHVSSQFALINSNSNDNIKSNDNEVTLERKRFSEENIETIVIKDRQKFPQKQKLSTDNIRNNNMNNNNNSINNEKSQQLRDIPKSMPLIGILKSTTTQLDLIKYRPKNKCLVFKEGDPLIIGYSIDKLDHDHHHHNGYDVSDNDEDVGHYENDNDDDDDDDDDEDEDEDEDEDDDHDDYEECFSSDDKQLRELTRQNTKYNSNFANFAVPNCDDKNKNKQMNRLMDEKPNDQKVTNNSAKSNAIDCQTISNEVIPKVCEKLVQNGINETIEAMNASNSDNQTQSSDSLYSSTCDVIPMSTSSDSSSDEKEDLHQMDENFDEVLNLRESQSTDNSSEQSLEHDSEVDNTSTSSEPNLEEKDKSKSESKVQNILEKVKPIIPVKPNILSPKPIPKSDTDNKEQTEQLTEVSTNTSVLYDESIVSYDENYLPQIVSDHIYQEIYDNAESIGGKIMSEQNNNIVEEKRVEINPSEKREIKLAELAQELELVRHLKRPAPQPPKRGEDVAEDDDNKLSINSINVLASVCDKQSSQQSSSKHRFSIKKLLHKKSSTTSDKTTKSQTTDSLTITHSESSSYSITTSNPKAWKQSEFDRSNLKIIHPIDLVETSTQQNSETVKEIEVKPEVQTRPEAPPRTPKPVRPLVPTRKKTKLLTSPTREPPPPPDRSPPTPAVNLTIKSTLTEAYNQLAKSNYSNLMAIKNKIESLYTTQYKWSDFEIGTGLRYGSAMIYKDSIVSNTAKSVNLLVLPNCYSAPIVHQFRHHSELVLVLDQRWTGYHLLDDLTENTFEQKQTNSLILQLYSILEKCENNNCNELPSNTINSIIICCSLNDILLIVPFNHNSHEDGISYITLHQFLSQVLEKLLPNSLFESVAHVLSQQTISISHSKTIVQLIAFQTPVDEIDCEVQINYWFDISRCKFINQFCVNESQLTQLDYIYLQFLCSSNAKLIRNAIALMINSK